jgi:hypothetical protein
MLTIKVFPDNGEPYTVVAGSRQIMLWEQIGRGNTLARLNDNPRMDDFYFIAHLTSVKQGRFSGSLDEFKNSVDLEVVPPVEGDEDPTRPGPSPG